MLNIMYIHNNYKDVFIIYLSRKLYDFEKKLIKHDDFYYDMYCFCLQKILENPYLSLKKYSDLSQIKDILKDMNDNDNIKDRESFTQYFLRNQYIWKA
jgi:hypothetical protein